MRERGEDVLELPPMSRALAVPPPGFTDLPVEEQTTCRLSGTSSRLIRRRCPFQGGIGKYWMNGWRSTRRIRTKVFHGKNSGLSFRPK